MTSRSLLLFGTLALCGPVCLRAQATTKPPKETQAQLRKQATITLAAASATALKEVPAGKIREHELEREHGRLIYSFDIKIAGKTGTEEVNIDARTGVLVDHTHESPEAEARESAGKPGGE